MDSLHIIITTYNRPASLKTLLVQLIGQARDRPVAVTIYDDCSPNDPTAMVAELNAPFSIEVQRATKNRGKHGYWQTFQDAFTRVRKAQPDLVLFLQDDLELEPNFFETMLHTWQAIDDPEKCALYCMLDGRAGATMFPKYPNERQQLNGLDIYRSQWFDLAAFVAGPKFFELLDYKVLPVPASRWTKNKLLSSGVARQLTGRLLNARAAIYQVASSLVLHGAHASVMNPYSRSASPLISLHTTTMLSIIFAIKDRSKRAVSWDGRVAQGPNKGKWHRNEATEKTLTLLPDCIESLARAWKPGDKWEIIVVDFASTDWPLDSWIHEKSGNIPVTVIPLNETFCKGRGLNLAASKAKGSVLFFCDADMLVPRGTIETGIKAAREGSAYFPICYSFENPQHTRGWWRHTGYGNLIVPQSLFAEKGGWWEKNSWGAEDDDMHDKLKSYTVRGNSEGFIHQWHPAGEFKTAAYKTPPEPPPAPVVKPVATDGFIQPENPVLVTTYFSGVQNPKAKVKLAADTYEHIQPWYDSVKALGVRGIIFHDGCSDAFVKRYTTEHITFERVGGLREAGIAPTDYRWFVYADYFVRHTEFDAVFSSTCSNVHVRNNPAETIQAGIVYVGSESGYHNKVKRESGIIGDSRWCRNLFRHCYPSFAYWDKLILNCAIIGGDRQTFVDAVSAMRDEILAINPQRDDFEKHGVPFSIDMAVTNQVLYSQYADQISTGAPLHSIFKGFELNRTDVAYIIK